MSGHDYPLPREQVVGIVWSECIPRRRFQNTCSGCKRSMNTTTSELGSIRTLRHYSARRQKHCVTFFCDAPGVETVTLVGDFNGWDPAATPMRQTPDGRLRSMQRVRPRLVTRHSKVETSDRQASSGAADAAGVTRCGAHGRTH